MNSFHLLVLILCACASAVAQGYPISSLDLASLRQDSGSPSLDRSAGGRTISLRGVSHLSGVGTIANSTYCLALNGNAISFSAVVGVDDEVGIGRGSVRFRVSGDGRDLWQSSVLSAGDVPVSVSLNLRGVKILVLIVEDAGDGNQDDHADWADARIVMSQGAPQPGWPAGGAAYQPATFDLGAVTQDWGQPHTDRSVDSNPLSIGGVKFAFGLGTHALSSMKIRLSGRGTLFTAKVGVDDEVGKRGAIIFTVRGNGRNLAQSPVKKGGDPATLLQADLAGIEELELFVDKAGANIDYDHADWADALITMFDGHPASEVYWERPVILTPPVPSRPRINGPKVFGVRPGSPFLYRIPASGDGPLSFGAKDLPAGLTLDRATGIINGSIALPGEYAVKLQVFALRRDGSQAAGRRPVAIRPADERDFRIVVGSRISLTPPLGWNSWNAFACNVTEGAVRTAADALVSSGLAAHGWTYINIDDCWEGGRDAAGNIQTNSRFPDLKGLADYIHSKGLKIGIYSSPGPSTCAGYTGSYQHELQDAQTYAALGIDYLKYDWCSYSRIAAGSGLDEAQKPYRLMRQALDQVNRDIVYSLCQYGNNAVWQWGDSVGGNTWRTTGDITDTWSSMSGIGFSQSAIASNAGPGHWNDPDMLVIGQLGWGNPRPTRLLANEQYTHITLWTLLAAPLLLGFDLTKLDDFTRSLLVNDEVLAINQDPLGSAASRVTQNGQLEVWSRDLADGSKAVGLFNRGASAATVTANWSDLGLSGAKAVRDVWRQQDLGVFGARFETQVPRHGAVLLQIGR